MRRRWPAILLLLAALAGGCDGKDPAAAPPPPVTLTSDAVGHYCGMTLTEHPGPKGQILVRGSDRPVWFSSVRDTLAFTLLAEEAKTLRAIYVSDMGHAASWDQPGASNWIDARGAQFVVGSSLRGGMGAPEAVPFADRAAADRFAAEHGGRVLGFREIPAEWVLGDDGGPADPDQAPAAPQHSGH